MEKLYSIIDIMEVLMNLNEPNSGGSHDFFGSDLALKGLKRGICIWHLSHRILKM